MYDIGGRARNRGACRSCRHFVACLVSELMISSRNGAGSALMGCVARSEPAAHPTTSNLGASSKLSQRRGFGTHYAREAESAFSRTAKQMFPFASSHILPCRCSSLGPPPTPPPYLPAAWLVGRVHHCMRRHPPHHHYPKTNKSLGGGWGPLAPAAMPLQQGVGRTTPLGQAEWQVPGDPKRQGREYEEGDIHIHSFAPDAGGGRRGGGRDQERI